MMNRQPNNSNSNRNSPSGNIDRIRQSETIERQKRLRRVAIAKKNERLRLARLNKIKQAVIAWAILIAVVTLVITVIASIISSCSKNSDDNNENGEISAKELSVISDFLNSNSVIYSSEQNKTYSAMNSLLTDFALNGKDSDGETLFSTNPSEFSWQADRYNWYSDKTYIRKVKDNIRDCGMFSNGYIWSSFENMKSDETQKYLYDTNSRFICAVSSICLWEADTSFLYERDTHQGQRLDFSYNMTVLEKLEKAVGYFFDNNDPNGGGIRYNENDGLVYILTSDNNGQTTGAGSNFWFNHRFGYLDAYNNICFYEAMLSLSDLYSFMGQPEKAEQYALIAQKNKQAINARFWDSEKSRYIGCIDINGKQYDNGFVFLNLEAISSGVSGSKKAKEILSWLDGTSEKNTTDSSSGQDIYKFGFVPRSTTIASNDTWWDYVDGKYPLSTDASFGRYWQNGSGAIITGYYDILARKMFDKQGLKQRISALSDSVSNGSFKKAFEDVLASGNPVVSATMPSSICYGVFGLDTDGVTLTLNPTLPEYSGYVGIKDIGFGTNSLAFLFSDNSVFVTSKSLTSLKLNIGGLSKDSEYELCVISDNKVSTTEKVKSDSDGFIQISKRFGDTSYIRVTEVSGDKN